MMSEHNSVKCPICQHLILVAWNGKMYDDKKINEKIERHINNHTIGDIRDFIGLNLAGQINELEKRLKECEGAKKQ